MTSNGSPRHPGRLVRSLTIVQAASVILANVIGTGVFVKTRVMTCDVGEPGAANCACRRMAEFRCFQYSVRS